MTSSAFAERRGVGLLALVSIGILLASMVLALRPAPALASETEDCLQPLDVVLIIDRSGSMLTPQPDEDGTANDGPTRLAWAKTAATGFVNALNAPGNGGVGGNGLHRVAVTSYGGNFGTAGAATTQLNLNDDALAGPDPGSVIDAINGVTANAQANTPLEDGINEGTAQAPQFRDFEAGVPVHHVFIALSDGKPWPQGNATELNGTDPRFPDDTPIDNYLGAVDEAFGIAIGEGGTGAFNPDLTLMQALSAPSAAFPAGNFVHILDAGDLPDLFSALADRLLCGDIQVDKRVNGQDSIPPVAPGTDVTYTYAVTNSGETPMFDIVVSDDKCTPVTGPVKSGGDQDEFLEVGETWTYTCGPWDVPGPLPLTNIVTATGKFIGGGTDSDTDTVTVEVIPPEPGTPGISIVKDHLGPDTLPEGGGSVTYTYDVTNTSEDVDLDNVVVKDFIDGTNTVACSPLVLKSGDDGDGILEAGDPGETWHYECTVSVTKVGTTTNNACVEALAFEEDKVGPICDKDTVNVPEGGEEGETGIPDTSVSVPGVGGPLATLIFGALLVASLSTLAYANVRAARQRR